MVDDLVIDMLRREEIPEAAVVVSQALVTDPNFIALFGGKPEPRRARIEKAIRIANLDHPKAVALAARLDGRLVGVINLVEWPYCQVSFLEGLRFFPQFASIMRGGLLRAARLQAISARLDPREPHWHIGPMGILPSVHRQGIGMAMFQKLLAFLDERHGASYYETDVDFIKNVCLHFGYQVRSELDIFGVHNWCVWRPAQP